MSLVFPLLSDRFLLFVFHAVLTLLFAEPASEEVLGKIANLDRDDIKRAISSADLGQIEYYQTTTAQQRGVLLRKWYDAIIKNQDDCMFLLGLLMLPINVRRIRRAILIFLLYSGPNSYSRERQNLH